jgi:hypothetical protein
MFSSCCVCTPPKSNFATVANWPAALPVNVGSCECCGLGPGPGFPPYGNCNGCNSCGHGDVLDSKLACEIPWLKPMPIACGEQVSVNIPWAFPLDPQELDGATGNKKLPGRYPWTVQCVKVCGEASIQFDHEDTINAATPPPVSTSEAYTIGLCVRVPVELVVSDACSYTYCLHSWYCQHVKIELCRKAGLLGQDIHAYIKINVRLTAPIYIADYTNNLASNNNPANDETCDGCLSSLVGASEYLWLPSTTLHSEISVCLTKMVPYGVVCG